MLKSIPLICLIAIGLFLSQGFTVHAKTPDGVTPSEETVCDVFQGPAFGLCNAFCEAMDCDSDAPKASEKACNKVQANFEKKTGETLPCLDPCLACANYEYCIDGQCVDPCADFVDGNPDNQCPCGYFDVPATDACWIQSQDDQQFFFPCELDGCLVGSNNDSCSIATGMPLSRLIRMQAIQSNGAFSCFINDFSSDTCMGTEGGFADNLTEAQFLTCLCRIEQYADELEGDANIDFVNGDPPFSCSLCGNGILNQTEVCDDGNTDSGDGCSGDCSIVEPGFECPTPGEPCIMDTCGDGILDQDEICDDGNTDVGDGCSEDCSFVEPGFECPTPGEPCVVENP